MEINNVKFPLKDAVAKGDLLRELGSLQQLQGLQAAQLALNNVAHGAVVRHQMRADASMKWEPLAQGAIFKAGL